MHPQAVLPSRSGRRATLASALKLTLLHRALRQFQLAGVVCLTALSGIAAESATNSVAASAARDLSLLIQTTQRAWAYADDKQQNFGVDLKQLRNSASAKLQQCCSKAEAFEVLRQVVVGLKDGHASLRLITPPAEPAEGRIKGTFHDTCEGVVYENRLLLKWNGEEAQTHVGALANRTFASTPGMARQLAIQKLPWGPLGETVRVKLKDLNGAEEETLLRYEESPEKTPPALEIRWPQPTIAYLALRTFDVRKSSWGVDTKGPVNVSGLPTGAVKAVQDKLSQAFATCAGAKALILDLRGNMGGSDSIGSHAALHLVDGDFCYFKLQTRFSPELKKLPTFKDSQDTGWSTYEPGWKPSRPAGIKPFTGLVWVLLDERCFSTTDNLLACLRDLLPKERARFLGRPSGAGTGAPRALVTLPYTDSTLTLTVMKVYSPSGRLIEGRGTIPDRVIRWTWKDVAENRDPDLETALAEAKARLP